jgi:ribose/xylose/arabinose/galactoside ABC-type transport system permease subunit
MNILGWPVGAAFLCTLLACCLVGLLNGVLVGLLRLRAFLTTLVTLIIVRAVVDMLLLKYAVQISGGFADSEIWDFIGSGSVFGLAFSFILLIAAVLIGHVLLSRTRPGWRIMAVGGSRRSAHNSGISVRWTVCSTYVLSGALVGVAGFMYAARLSSAGADAGFGMELAALTAALLGGNSLGGGRGSTGKALTGAIIVLVITNGVVRLGIPSGAGGMLLGLILLLAAALDVRWLKNRHKVLSKVYVSPTVNDLPPCPATAAGSGSPYEVNDKLRDVEIIGLGQVEAPEDVIFDLADNLYCGTRHGDVMRFLAPDYKKLELFAHIGGQPLGLAFDREQNLYVCVGGMGLYSVAPDGTVSKATDETNRSTFPVSGSPTISTSRPTAGSSSRKPPSATKCISGRSIHWRAAATAASSATTLATIRPARSFAISSFPTASAPATTANPSCSPRLGAAASSGIGSMDLRAAVWKPSSLRCRVIRTISIAPQMVTIGWRLLACVRPRSISLSGCPASGAACRGASRKTNGSIPISTPAAW